MRVELGAIEPIRKAVAQWRTLIGVAQGRGITLGETRPPATFLKAAGDALRKLAFDPLLPALGDAQHLTVLLDDVLHSIPLDALPRAPRSAKPGKAPPASDLLGGQFRIHQRLTLQEVLSAQPEPAAEGILLALGAADFDAVPSTYDSNEKPSDIEKPARAVAAILRGGAWEHGFQTLEHTGVETRGVAALHSEVNGEKARSIVLEKSKASRASVAALAPQARWLHLATHGWFAPEAVPSWSDAEPLDKYTGVGVQTSAQNRVRGESPMALCGLALAGANLPADAVGRYPGLLTAEEIAGWDLSNCEIAVVSACDSNVGERRAGQGVASLQRALHMAGARSVITSLWKVPDEATKTLMLEFYRRLWKLEEPAATALWNAKKTLREAKNKNGTSTYQTRDWAAWVLTGDPN